MQIPKNVIQTGEPDPCHKIYVEDYVHTLLTQYRENEADFCLYGKLEQEGEITYYFIYGAAKEEPGWELMESRYFALQRRIGEVTFDEKDAWAFFEDGYSAPLSGCFIFYEQNEDMQSYLIAMHQNRPGESPVPFRHRAAGQAGPAGGPVKENAGSGPKKPDSTRTMPQDERKSCAPDGGKEPRRILRRPVVYDLKKESSDTEGQEKVLHAAQTGPRQQRRNKDGKRGYPVGRSEGGETGGAGGGEKKTDFRVRAAAAAVFLGLCAAALTSADGDGKMKAVGNCFTQAPEEKIRPKEEDADQGREAENSPLVVEETRIRVPEYPIAEETAAEDSAAEDSTAEDSTAEDSAAEEITAGESAADAAAAEDMLSDAEKEEPSETVPDISRAEQETVLASETGSSDETASSPETAAYIVQKGDSLAEICRRQYGTAERVEEVAELNRLVNPNHLIPGQKILLPE